MAAVAILEIQVRAYKMGNYRPILMELRREGKEWEVEKMPCM
jgi:hypothetical protein